MKKIGKFLLTLAIVGCISGSLLQVGSISKLKDDLVALGKQSIHYFISLNQRIKELEDAQKDVPVMGEDVTDTHTPNTSAIDTNQESPTQNPTMDTDQPQETTKPTMSTPQHNPETTPTELLTESVTMAEPDTETEQDTEAQTEATIDTTQTYRIGIYQGIIGVFDKEGHLIDTCNVSVLTLPQKDREMLEAGILVSTLEEVHALLENFV